MAGEDLRPGSVSEQEVLELRHDVEVLTHRCRRMYEEANELVERLRRLQASWPVAPTDQRPSAGGRAAGLPGERRRHARRRTGKGNAVRPKD